MKTSTAPASPQRTDRPRPHEPPRDWLWQMLSTQGRQKLKESYRGYGR